MFDFLTSLPSILFVEEQAGNSSYAVEGSEGIVVIVVYVIDIVINGLICLQIWKKIGKTMDFEEMRENW